MYGSYQEKPLDHYSIGDWHAYNKNLETITEKQNVIGNNVRQESQQMRNATSNTIAWKLKNTNQKLSERIHDVEQWFRNLDRTLKEVTDAIARLAEAKIEVERSLADNLPLLEVAKECLSLRDRRRDIDLVDDVVHAELQKEVRLIETINNKLRDCSHRDWEHLVRLKEQRDQVVADLEDKELAAKIDRFQLRLNRASTHIISLKPWPTEATTETPVSMETWLQNCLDKRKAAEDAIDAATEATNASWNLVRQSNNDIRFQRDATRFALKKRRHDTLNARDTLAAQRKDLMDEIQRLDKEMLQLERNIDETRGNLKLVHTRLENRKFRPRVELCRDFATLGLEEELRHVTESREHLSQQLKDLKNVLNGVQQHLHEVEDDLQRKERSLAIETSCLDIHSRPAKSPYQMDTAWLAPAQTSSGSYLKESVDRGTNRRILDRQGYRGNPGKLDPEYTLVD